MASPKDKQELVLNPVTGQLDTVQKFNVDRIITHSCFPTGYKLKMYDPESGAYVESDDLEVTDSNGNLVVI